MLCYREFLLVYNQDASQNQIEKLDTHPDWVLFVTAISRNRVSFKHYLSRH